jgi:hypothetical protein
MTTRNERNVYDVNCEHCGALVGEQCRKHTTGGATVMTRPHAVRRDRARAACKSAIVDCFDHATAPLTKRDIKDTTYWNSTTISSVLASMVASGEIVRNANAYSYPEPVKTDTLTEVSEGVNDPIALAVLAVLATCENETAIAFEIADEIDADRAAVYDALAALRSAGKVHLHIGDENRPVHLRSYTLTHNPCNYHPCSKCERTIAGHADLCADCYADVVDEAVKLRLARDGQLTFKALLTALECEGDDLDASLTRLVLAGDVQQGRFDPELPFVLYRLASDEPLAPVNDNDEEQDELNALSDALDAIPEMTDEECAALMSAIVETLPVAPAGKSFEALQHALTVRLGTVSAHDFAVALNELLTAGRVLRINGLYSVMTDHDPDPSDDVCTHCRKSVDDCSCDWKKTDPENARIYASPLPSLETIAREAATALARFPFVETASTSLSISVESICAGDDHEPFVTLDPHSARLIAARLSLLQALAEIALEDSHVAAAWYRAFNASH